MTSRDSNEAFALALDSFSKLALSRHSTLQDARTTATQAALDKALQELPREMSSEGIGITATFSLLRDTVLEALAGGQSGPRYFGFVTGGVTPAAQLSDFLATLYDSNAQVNLPTETIATYLEHLTLKYVLELLHLSPDDFKGRAITSGATSANILGLSLGREYVVRRIKAAQGVKDYSVADSGCDVPIRVYSAGAHASTSKAASILGIGRTNVVELVDVQRTDSFVCFDLDLLEEELKKCQELGFGAIVVASIGEVNTGHCTLDMDRIGELCVSSLPRFDISL
jgi:glutamate/tyrosine decarboxylase-like PLP-dependent enzyme